MQAQMRLSACVRGMADSPTTSSSSHTKPYDIEFFSRSVRQTTYLGSRLAVDDLPFSRLAVDDLPGNRLVNAEKLPNEEKSDIRTYQNAQKNPDDFLEVQTTSWKSRRLPGSPEDFVRRLPRSLDDFQTTSRRLTGKSSQKSSRSEKPAHQIQI
ncbi:hypothetical protein YC2023_095412 [Brassica napus]